MHSVFQLGPPCFLDPRIVDSGCQILRSLHSFYPIFFSVEVSLRKPKQNQNKNGQRVWRTDQFRHPTLCRAAARHTSVFCSLFLSVAQVVSFQKVHQNPTELLWKEDIFWESYLDLLFLISFLFLVIVFSGNISSPLAFSSFPFRKMLSVPFITHHLNST